jgi:hypothetical protein
MTRSTVPSIDACMAAQHKALCWPCRLQLSQHSSYAVLRGAARKLNGAWCCTSGQQLNANCWKQERESSGVQAPCPNQLLMDKPHSCARSRRAQAAGPVQARPAKPIMHSFTN